MRLPTEGPEARCDRERVAQIMRILLDNAIRHTPEGRHAGHRSPARAASNGTASLTVSDLGPGLSESTRTQAFERFFTGDAARGAGLGLAIARELAERMDGRLRLAPHERRRDLHARPPGRRASRVRSAAARGWPPSLAIAGAGCSVDG